jgi:hypothetical protein
VAETRDVVVVKDKTIVAAVTVAAVAWVNIIMVILQYLLQRKGLLFYWKTRFYDKFVEFLGCESQDVLIRFVK